MQFLVDAQLPPALARWLSDQGHASEHVVDQGMQAAKDAEIWSYANKVGAIIVTKDEDFARLATVNRDGPKVVWLRIGNSTRSRLLEWMSRALPAILRALDGDDRVVEIAPLD